MRKRRGGGYMEKEKTGKEVLKDAYLISGIYI